MSPDLATAVAKSMERFNALTPEQQREHRELQRQSFIRGMTTPCEHGVLDFEQCGDCVAAAEARIRSRELSDEQG